uniref:Protein quiver n=1 Tax=Biomphalaria glabrata TaxID=6526 RepID=A0A2C9L695_BIOGL
MMTSLTVLLKPNARYSLVWLTALMSLVLQTVSGLACVQCVSLNTPDCQYGDIPATPCTGQHKNAKYCFKTRAKIVPTGHGEVVSRGCTDLLQSNCTEQLVGGEFYWKCYYSCSEDGCNRSPLTIKAANFAVVFVVSSFTAALLSWGKDLLSVLD